MKRRDTIKRAERMWDEWDKSLRDGSAGAAAFELCHSEKRLKKIQDSLSPFAMDVESLMGEIEMIAMRFDGPPFWKFAPTPRDAAGDIRETVTKIEALLERLDRHPHNYGDVPVDIDAPRLGLAFPPLKTLPGAMSALALLRDELKPRIDKLMAMNRAGRNASQPHRKYWRALTQLWWEATAHKADRRQHKHLVEFLIACSEPLFPKATKTSAVSAFVEETWPFSKRSLLKT
jgi:hypothetical protein